MPSPFHHRGEGEDKFIRPYGFALELDPFRSYRKLRKCRADLFFGYSHIIIDKKDKGTGINVCMII